MFNFGDDDKEKLKENMEQIKDMVNQGETIGQEVQEPSDQEPFDGGLDQGSEPESPRQETSQPSPPKEQESGDGQTMSFSGDGQQQQASQPDTGQDREIEQMEQELQEGSFDEEFGQGQEKQQVEGGPSPGPEAGQQRSKTTRSGIMDSRDVEQLSQQVPSPPSTGDVDVPEIDRGPLFLRRQKFRKAKQMIDEMIYLSKEVEDTVNALEAGIQEDQRTEQDVREMLKEFEENRTEVEDIVSPREE